MWGMLVRTSRYAYYPGTPICVVIADSFDDGLAAVRGDLHSLLSRRNAGYVEVYAPRAQLPVDAVEQLGVPDDLAARVVEPNPAFTPSSGPRAGVTLSGYTWQSGNYDAPAHELAGFRPVNRLWEVRVCPQGVDFKVHEVAQTLIWDAEEAGDRLPEISAYALAERLCG